MRILLFNILLLFNKQMVEAAFNFGENGGFGGFPSFPGFTFPEAPTPAPSTPGETPAPSFGNLFFGPFPPFSPPTTPTSPFIFPELGTTPTPTPTPTPSPSASPSPSPSPSPIDQCEEGGSQPSSPIFFDGNGIFGGFGGFGGFGTPSPSPSSGGSQCSPPPPPMSPPPSPDGNTDGNNCESCNPKEFPVDPEILTSGTVISDEQIQTLYRIVDECPNNPDPVFGTFIRKSGTGFSKGGNRFNFVGFNAYQMVYQVLQNQKYKVEQLISNAASLGMKVGRMWAFSDRIRTDAVTWDENVYEAMDEVLSIAKNNDLHMVVALTNYWKEYISPELYIYWAYGTVEGRTVRDFYTDATVRLLYKAHVCNTLNRINTKTGVRYRDDTTIMAWNLMNEPRCAGCPLNVINDWVQEMASYVKSIDPNHLVTVGMEGFHIESSLGNGDNPGKWALCQGIDFIQTHQQPGIDYMAAHYYPSWKGYDWDNNRQCDLTCKFEWAQQAVQTHAQLATQFQKPFVIEEFGVSVKDTYEDPTTGRQDVFFTTADRVDFYKRLIGEIVSSNNRGEAGAGAMFWTLAVQGYPDYGGYTVYMDAVVTPTGIGFPLSKEENDRFRRDTFETECANQAQNNGWRPNAVNPKPVTIIGGQRELDVVREAARLLG